jgi:hypothetical protein
MAAFSLRAATAADVQALHRLMRDFAAHERAQERFQITEAALHTALFTPNPPIYGMLAICDGKIVGLGAMVTSLLASPNWWRRERRSRELRCARADLDAADSIDDAARACKELRQEHSAGQSRTARRTRTRLCAAGVGRSQLHDRCAGAGHRWSADVVTRWPSLELHAFKPAWHEFRPGDAIWCTTAIICIMCPGLATGQLVLALVASTGALVVGFAAFQQYLRTPMIAMALGARLSAGIGTLANAWRPRKQCAPFCGASV